MFKWVKYYVWVLGIYLYESLTILTKETFQIKFNNNKKYFTKLPWTYSILFKMILLYNQYVGWHFAYN